MDGTSDQLLARAGLTRNQDDGIGRRDTCNAVADVSDGLAFAINLRGSFQSHNGILQQDVLTQKPGTLTSSADSGAHDLGLKRLGQKVECALPYAFGGQFDGGHGGQKDHRNRRIDFAGERENRQPFSVRHFLIRNHDVEVIGRESSLRLLNPGGFPEFMLILAQVRGQDEAHARFIVDNENSSHSYVFFSFSRLFLWGDAYHLGVVHWCSPETLPSIGSAVPPRRSRS